MNKFYLKDGRLKPKYLLKNLINKKNELWELKIPHNMEWCIDVCFQRCRFEIREAISKLDNSGLCEVEFLPGIYIGYKYLNTTMRKIIDMITGSRHYVIKVLNSKDNFTIESTLERRTDESKDAVESCSGIENLDPRIFKQPSLLGGGKCGGCIILSYFSRLGLEGKTSIDGYYFWDLAELVEATKKEPFFLELCKTSKCYETYQSIVKDGYAARLEERDQIKVEVNGGIYEVGEGKHRVCAMKRFGYDHKVPMRVTRSAGTTKYDHVTESHDMERVLKDCYDRYRVLGIPDEVVRRCLRDPSATVMDYLNASCYSYEEMYERCKPTIG